MSARSVGFFLLLFWSCGGPSRPLENPFDHASEIPLKTEVSIFAENRKLVVKWTRPETEVPIESYRVWRSLQDEKWASIAEVKDQLLYFESNPVPGGIKRAYAITAISSGYASSKSLPAVLSASDDLDGDGMMDGDCDDADTLVRHGCGSECADECVAPETCGGGGETDVCGCTPDCAGKCGGSDGCYGTCPDNCVAPETCGGGGAENVCGEPGIWHDSSSNLTWKINDAGAMSWQEAMDYCDSMGRGWHLPAIGEPRSLIRGCPKNQAGGSCNVSDDDCLDWLCRVGACGGCGYLAGPDNGCYWPSQIEGECSTHWSSSSCASSSYVARGVYFNHGGVGNNDKTNNSNVRCVRGGPER